MKRFVPVLLLAGLAGIAGCGESDPVTVASGDRTAETTGPLETTTTALPTSTTSATAAVPSTAVTTAAPLTTTTTRPPTTTTTRPAATTTTRRAARTITLTTRPEGDFTKVTVRGDGCQGPEYGVGLNVKDASGQEVNGDGGLAQPDGTWQLEEYFGHYMAAGTYTFSASCIVTNGPVVFSYAPATFDWAG